MRVLDASAITRLARWNHCMYGASRIRGLSLVISMVRLFPLLHYSGERVAATEPGCRGGTADRKREKKKKKKRKKKEYEADDRCSSAGFGFLRSTHLPREGG